VALVALVALGFAIFHWDGPGPVSSAAPPTRLPACPHPGAWGGGSSLAVFRVTVDPDPIAVTAIRWPALGEPPCGATLATAPQPVAVALAADVRAAPPPLGGVVECPNDTAELIDLYFEYPGGHWERVRDHSTGCATVFAPHRKPRQGFPLYDDLKRLIPAG
jgi:hypothetical protein